MARCDLLWADPPVRDDFYVFGTARTATAAAARLAPARSIVA